MTARKALSPEQGAALTTFKMANGRYWKRALLKLWQEGGDENQPYLRQLRNQFGPTWLMRY